MGQPALTINFKWVRPLPKGKVVVHYRVQARSEVFTVEILDHVCKNLYDTRWKQILVSQIPLLLFSGLRNVYSPDLVILQYPKL